jgi:hypothetical protein
MRSHDNSRGFPNIADLAVWSTYREEVGTGIILDVQLGASRGNGGLAGLVGISEYQRISEKGEAPPGLSQDRRAAVMAEGALLGKLLAALSAKHPAGPPLNEFLMNVAAFAAPPDRLYR